MIRTVIYGGSFDPVHKGHEAIINNLADRFDEVIVVPTSISPFKRDNKAAPPELRLKMLLSCDFKDNVTVSDYEIAKKGCSYSIDTVKHFSRSDRRLYFAIGSEGARSVHKWRCVDELMRLVTFYVIKRPGYDESVLSEEFEYADFCGEDISSSEVKVAVAMNRADGLVCERVGEIIKSYGLYDDYAKYTASYPVFGLKKERIDHTFRATIEGIKLAKRYDVDVKDCTIALIMHDIGKYATPQLLEKYSIPVPKCDDLPVECRHAEYGAAICRYYFGLPDNIVEAVRTHTTCGMDMDALGEIVALADYIEPGRSFSGVEEVRKAASISLALAMELMLKKTIDYLKAQNKYIAPITERVYRKYTEINRGTHYGTNQNTQS